MPKEIVETLGKTYGNTARNGRRWLGNWGNITLRESNNLAENETDKF